MTKKALTKIALLGVLPLFSLSGCLAAAIPLAARAPVNDVRVTETVIVTETAAAPAHHVERLRCGANDVQIETIGDNLAAVVNGTYRVMLHQVVVASGAKYADPSLGIALWNHHSGWQLIVNEGAANEQWVECTTVH